MGGGKLRTFGGPFFVMVQSSIFRSKVLFANFDQTFFAPRKFGFSPKSSIYALLKVRKFGNRTSRQKKIFAQKFYLRTLAKKFSLRESSVLCPKVLFANFGQHIFPPRKFGFAPKSSIRELSHFSKVRKFGKRTFGQKCFRTVQSSQKCAVSPH